MTVDDCGEAIRVWSKNNESHLPQTCTSGLAVSIQLQIERCRGSEYEIRAQIGSGCEIGRQSFNVNQKRS